MTDPSTTIVSSTRPVRPELVDLLRRLKPGQQIQITQTVRVGLQSWKAPVRGTFRKVDYLVTGLAIDRVPVDDIVVPLVHFTKDNGELSSITIDEQTMVEAVPG
jgi:hypothetical protein